jgi:drug/metabolite transporter (DMT)-like permease
LVQRSHTQGLELDLVPSVLIGAVISSFITLPWSVPFQATTADIQWLAILGLFQLAIPCVLSVVCAKVLKAAEVSLLALLAVVFGIALAWFGANERPAGQALLGGSMVLLALLLNELLAWRQRNV